MVSRALFVHICLLLVALVCVREGHESGDVVQVLGRDPACSNPDAPGD